MKPLEQVRRQITARVRRETYLKLVSLGREKGMRVGPMTATVLETVSECPPDRFWQALSAFQDEAKARR